MSFSICDETGYKSVLAIINTEHVVGGNFPVFYCFFLTSLQKINRLHNNKQPALSAACFVKILLTTAHGREKETKKRGGQRPNRKRATQKLRQLDFLFSVCLIRCQFMELPVVGRRERDTHPHKAEVFAVFRTEEREG